jgi:hypothetical protein
MSGQRLPVFKGGARGRANRDKTKPEPIMTPYRAFLKENKERFSNEHPHLEFHEISRILYDMWE